MLEKHRPAPDFTLPSDSGEAITLSGLKPMKVVLYFYPRDDTSGCTTEALEFSAALDAFRAANTTVLGISKDSVTKHAKFRDKHGLKVMLLSDEGADTCERYGVWVEKSMYGRTFMGIERSTFLIDPNGDIAKVWRKVRLKGHVDDVLQSARDL